MLMRGSDFIFDLVQMMYYKCHKIGFKRGGSYIDSPDWIKKKKATINPKNTDDMKKLSGIQQEFQIVNRL